MKDDFYLTLTSGTDSEFPSNHNSHFTKRVGNNIHLDKGQWKVGMTSLFIPDTGYVVSLDSIPNDTVLVDFEWSEEEKKPLAIKSRSLKVKKSDLGTLSTTYQILSDLVHAYEHSKLDQMKDETSLFTKYNGLYPNLNGIALKFTWKDNGDLFMDNETSFLGTYAPGFQVNKFLALRMGWIQEKKTGDGYELGPNLIATTLTLNGNPAFPRRAWDLDSEYIQKGWGSRDNTIMWGVAHNKTLYLSIAASWTFVVHNNISHHGAQLIQVRSNIIQSSLFNDTLVNLLAEVIYKRNNDGMAHIEPNLVRYVPVRHPRLDVVEIALYDILGQPLHLKGSLTSITLHFKRRRRHEFLPHSPQFCPSGISQQQGESLFGAITDETQSGGTMEGGTG